MIKETCTGIALYSLGAVAMNMTLQVIMRAHNKYSKNGKKFTDDDREFIAAASCGWPLTGPVAFIIGTTVILPSYILGNYLRDDEKDAQV